MNKLGLTLVGIVIVIVIGLGVVMLMHGSNGTPGSNSSAGGNVQTAPSSQSVATITYDGSSFSSAQVTITSGQVVTFKNTSSDPVDVDSDPHPTHTDNPELNIGEIAPGQSQSVKLTTKGNWGYHNHLNPGQRGRIIVQ